MKVTIGNLGDTPVHIIVDGDTDNETVLDSGASNDFEGATIELRDLADEADEETSGTDEAEAE